MKLLCALGLHKWHSPPAVIHNHEGEYSHTEWTCYRCGHVEEQWLDHAGNLQHASKRERTS